MARLARDTRGNTLAIAAAAVIPLLGMVGSGVDLGRAYLLKTRLQQACDAGVLAARKSMSGNALAGDTTANTRGREFFDINLRNEQYGVKSVAFKMNDVMSKNGGTATASGRVHGTASADVPTVLMQIFGYTNIPIAAACDAELNLANNDIMFVLDVTGSMACTPGRSTNDCSGIVPGRTAQRPDGRWFTVEEDGSRIDALRSAVDGFYVTVSRNLAAGARLRLGFVPYSSGVNIGGLLPATTMNNGAISFASRRANFNTRVWTRQITNIGSATTETWPYQISNENCDKYADNKGFTQDNRTFTPTGGTGSPYPAYRDAELYTDSQPEASSHTLYTRSSVTWSSGNKSCVRRVQQQQVTYTQTAWRLTDFTYTDVPLSVAGYMNGGVAIATDIDGADRLTIAGYPATSSAASRSLDPIQLAQAALNGSATGITTFNSGWTNQCVEERLTGRDSITDPANTADSQWRAAWPNVIWRRPGTAAITNGSNYTRPDSSASGYGSTAYSCPKPAQGLEEMTQRQVNDYLSEDNGFVAHGYTYHDIGMVWATRLMSLRGPFAATHAAAANGRATMRHIIFMTDGDMQPTQLAYGQFGVEINNRRMIPSGQTLNDTTLQAAHNARFAAACTAATRDEGISVWVVAFGQTLTSQLRSCASNPSQAFQANNAAQLNAAFAAIASKVAELRLTA